MLPRQPRPKVSTTVKLLLTSLTPRIEITHTDHVTLVNFQYTYVIHFKIIENVVICKNITAIVCTKLANLASRC